MKFKAAMLTTLIWAVVAFAGSPSAAVASVTCNVVASPAGADTNAGTINSPVLTVGKALDVAQANQTVCLRSGTYDGADDGAASAMTSVDKPGLTLTSYPGERARLNGQLKVQDEATGATVSNLDIDGNNAGVHVSIQIIGDDVTLSGNDITNDNQEICIVIAGWNSSRVKNTVIQDNRIHGCGKIPSHNQDHGIYISHADDTVIRGNWIYDNVDRGVQLYPDAQRTLIEGNVIDGNGEGISFGGENGVSSSGATVRNNVISNSTTRYNVESYYPEGTPAGTDNRVKNNCIFGAADGFATSDGSGIAQDETGFDASNNIVAKPKFVGPATQDLTLDPSSACAAIVDGATGATPPVAVDPVAGASIRIKTNVHRVTAGHKVRLRGSVRGVDSAQATVVEQVKGNWVKVATPHLSATGSFKATKRVRSSARFRAVVPGVGSSRIVKVRVSASHRKHARH